MKNFSTSDRIAVAVLIAGGLNWGLVGLFHFDLVAKSLGSVWILARLVYVAVGASAVYMMTILPKLGKEE